MLVVVDVSLPRVVVVGASYGMLLAMRMAIAGVSVTVIGRPNEVEAIRAAGGPRVRIAARESGPTLELTDVDAGGRLTFDTPESVDLEACDLIFLAASEPQYSGEGLQEFMRRLAEAQLPCVSLMNLVPLPFIRRLPGIDADSLRGVYTSRELWNLFLPENVTASSPDPQSVRPEAGRPELSEVTLPTNFKVAPFVRPEHQRLLETVAEAIDRSRVERDGVKYHPKVRLRAVMSIYAPLSKWPMLIAGNCRCVTDAEPISIRDAIHSDLSTSRELYGWVVQQCLRLGAAESDMVEFDRYAEAALDLPRPSSLARALYAGAAAVERPDRLVLQLARNLGESNRMLADIVTKIDRLLAPSLSPKLK
jgi:hypothetical protein